MERFPSVVKKYLLISVANIINDEIAETFPMGSELFFSINLEGLTNEIS